MIDANEIIRALKLWFQPGDVFEVRVLDAISADWMRPHTESGYFDYEHITEVANAIGKLRSYRGAYVTVNPVKPELLARAWNRIRPILKEPTTADSEVLARRWLLIDCDPKRASGVSSTKAEHESGQGTRDPRRAFLAWLARSHHDRFRQRSAAHVPDRPPGNRRRSRPKMHQRVCTGFG